MDVNKFCELELSRMKRVELQCEKHQTHLSAISALPYSVPFFCLQTQLVKIKNVQKAHVIDVYFTHKRIHVRKDNLMVSHSRSKPAILRSQNNAFFSIEIKQKATSECNWKSDKAKV